jgi:hypothetical protein
MSEKTDGRTKAGCKALTEVVTTDLRALLFWANVGVAKSTATAGSYGAEINDIIESYAEYLGFKLPYALGFDAFKKTYQKQRKR